jgi:hypothetical protein
MTIEVDRQWVTGQVRYMQRELEWMQIRKADWHVGCD